MAAGNAEGGNGENDWKQQLADFHDSIRKSRSVNVVKMIDSNNAFVTGTNEAGQSAVHIAAAMPNSLMLRTLKDHEADLKAVDGNGNTVLHKAASVCSIPVISLLLETNAVDVNAQNNDGETALHIIAGIDSDDALTIAGLLRKREETRLDLKDNAGRTVFDKGSHVSCGMLKLLTGGSTAKLNALEREMFVKSMLYLIHNVDIAREDEEVAECVRMLSTLLDVGKPAHPRRGSWDGFDETRVERPSNAFLREAFGSTIGQEKKTSTDGASAVIAKTGETSSSVFSREALRSNLPLKSKSLEAPNEDKVTASAKDEGDGEVFSLAPVKGNWGKKAEFKVFRGQYLPRAEDVFAGNSKGYPSMFSPIRRPVLQRSGSIPHDMHFSDKDVHSKNTFSPMKLYSKKRQTLVKPDVMVNPPSVDVGPLPTNPALLPTTEDVESEASDDEVDIQPRKVVSDEEARKNWEAFELPGRVFAPVEVVLPKCPDKYENAAQYYETQKTIVKLERDAETAPLRLFFNINMTIQWSKENDVDWIASFYWLEFTKSGRVRPGQGVRIFKLAKVNGIQYSLKWTGNVILYQSNGFMKARCFLRDSPAVVPTPEQISGAKHEIRLLLSKNTKNLVRSTVKRLRLSEDSRHVQLLMNNVVDDWNQEKLSSAFDKWRDYAGSEECNYNDHQKLAIESALTRKLTLIHGPPGSGKTTTVVGLISFLAMGSEKLLITSASNHACDVITRQLVKQKLVDLDGIVRVAAAHREYDASDPVRTVLLDDLKTKHEKWQSIDDTMKSTRASYSAVMDAKQEHHRICRDIVNAARIVIATSMMSGSLLLGSIKFDTCIVDEASTVADTQAMHVLSHSVDRVVLVGDDKQMGPYIANRKVQEMGYVSTLFERLRKNPAFPSILLADGYRMSKDINEFPSETFYSGEFQSVRVVPKQIHWDWPTAKQMLCVFAATENEFKQHQGSRHNEQERIMVKVLVDDLVARNPECDILILSPYVLQVEKLRLVLPNSVRCKTIDSAQGDEASVVIITWVVQNEDDKHMLKGQFLDDDRRINVAITRARDALIHVGRLSLLCCSATLKKLFTKMVSENCGMRFGKGTDGTPRFVSYNSLTPPSKTVRAQKFSERNYVPHAFPSFSGKEVLKFSDIQKYFSVPVGHNFFIDSHCHVDVLIERHNFNLKFLVAVCDNQFMPRSYEGCITSFSDSHLAMKNDGQPTDLCLLIAKDPRIFSTFGCHPGFAYRYSDVLANFIRNAAANLKTMVGVGECGLDRSRHPDAITYLRQKEVFSAQIRLALELNKPLVLHARDAQEDCFFIMTQIPELRNHPIHFHCFSYNRQISDQWMRTFPNMKFGFTYNILWSAAIFDVAKHMPIDKILVETDAPYIRPNGVTAVPTVHPGMALGILGAIHKAKGCQMQFHELVKKVRENTRALYGI